MSTDNDTSPELPADIRKEIKERLQELSLGYPLNAFMVVMAQSIGCYAGAGPNPEAAVGLMHKLMEDAAQATKGFLAKHPAARARFRF